MSHLMIRCSLDCTSPAEEISRKIANFLFQIIIQNTRQSKKIPNPSGTFLCLYQRWIKGRIGLQAIFSSVPLTLFLAGHWEQCHLFSISFNVILSHYQIHSYSGQHKPGQDPCILFIQRLSYFQYLNKIKYNFA